MRFVVSSLRYLQHEYGLGVQSKTPAAGGKGTSHSSCEQKQVPADGGAYQCGSSARPKEHGGLPGRRADTHPGLILLGHSFGGVVARAAMVAAAQQENIGEQCVCPWLLPMRTSARYRQGDKQA